MWSLLLWPTNFTLLRRVMEIIGKGNYEKGSVWVARKVPDGYVCAHANQARITTFPLNDPENCVYSPDVISFARDIGLYPASARDEDFSFSDVYDAVTFSGARYTLLDIIFLSCLYVKY